MNPNSLVFSLPVSRNLGEAQRKRLFLINVIGKSPASRQFNHPVAIHRGILVDSKNEGMADINEAVVCAMVVDDTNDQHSQLYHAGKANMIVEQEHIVGVQGALYRGFDSRQQMLCVFEYMDLGSMYNVMARGYGGKLEEKHVIHVMKMVLSAMKSLDESSKSHGAICLSHVYLNSKGYLKLGFGASLVQYDGDDCLPLGRDGWDFIPPTRLWEIKLPEGRAEFQSDIDPKQADIWRFGILALELVYGGIRLTSEDDLFQEILEMVAKGDLPKSLDKRSRSSAELLPFYPPTVAAGVDEWTEVNLDAPPSKLSIHSPSKCKINKDLVQLILHCLKPVSSERPNLDELIAKFSPIAVRASKVSGKDYVKAMEKNKQK